MPRDRARAGNVLPALLASALLVVAGCGAPGPRESAGGIIPPDHSRAVLVPFENLSGREEQGTVFSRVFFAQLVASGAFEMVDPTRVEEAMDSLNIRSAGSLTPAQARVLADSLHAPYLLLGSVLESGRIQTGTADLPSVGATLRVLEASTGRVLWAGVHFRTGEDRETVFGWGQERDADRLVSSLASDMLRDFREAGAAYARRTRAEGTK